MSNLTIFDGTSHLAARLLFVHDEKGGMPLRAKRLWVNDGGGQRLGLFLRNPSPTPSGVSHSAQSDGLLLSWINGSAPEGHTWNLALSQAGDSSNGGYTASFTTGRHCTRVDVYDRYVSQNGAYTSNWRLKNSLTGLSSNAPYTAGPFLGYYQYDTIYVRLVGFNSAGERGFTLSGEIFLTSVGGTGPI